MVFKCQSCDPHWQVDSIIPFSFLLGKTANLKARQKKKKDCTTYGVTITVKDSKRINSIRTFEPHRKTVQYLIIDKKERKIHK